MTSITIPGADGRYQPRSLDSSWPIRFSDHSLSLSHRERWPAGPDRRGEAGGRARDGAGGAPGAFRGRGVSKSAAKAPRDGIGGEKKRGISTILLAGPGSIRAFATDLDKRRRRVPLGGAPRGGRRPRRTPPGAETCTSHSKVQFQPSFSSAKCTSRRRSGPAAVVANRGADLTRTTTRPPTRAIMTILTHEPPFPARKAHSLVVGVCSSVAGMCGGIIVIPTDRDTGFYIIPLARGVCCLVVRGLFVGRGCIRRRSASPEVSMEMTTAEPALNQPAWVLPPWVQETTAAPAVPGMGWLVAPRRGGGGQGVGEGCMVLTEGLEAATGGTSAMMTAATVRRARCWSASGLAPFALLRRTYREWPSG